MRNIVMMLVLCSTFCCVTCTASRIPSLPSSCAGAAPGEREHARRAAHRPLRVAQPAGHRADQRGLPRAARGGVHPCGGALLARQHWADSTVCTALLRNCNGTVVTQID